MPEQLRMTELLINHVDLIRDDVAEIKGGMERVVALLEVHKERQDKQEEKLTKIDDRLRVMEGEWRIGRLLVMLVGVVSTTWIGVAVKDLYQTIKHS